MHTGYGLDGPPETGSEEAVGERVLSTTSSTGSIALGPRASMVRVQPDDERRTWWVTTDAEPFLRWTADRSAVPDRHLAPVLSVGRTSSDVLVAELLRPAGPSVSAALDRLGAPSVGVAVTLTAPLLDLAVAAARGAVVLGRADPDDVVVDDAGAVVLCDRPPAAAVFEQDTADAGPPRRRAWWRDSPPSGARAAGLDAVEALVLATRIVWERVDPREPCRPGVDAALVAARSGDPDALDALRACVHAAAPPRPVRWDPPPSVFAFVDADPIAERRGPGSPSLDALRSAGRDALERGVPVGRRRVPVRQVFVGVLVVVGLTVAAVTALGP